MKVRRKIIITRVREQNLLIRRADGLTKLCSECPIDGLMASVASAAVISRQSLRAICRLVEAGEVHYTEGPEGLFVCLASLSGKLDG